MAKFFLGRPYTIFKDKSFELMNRSNFRSCQHTDMCLDYDDGNGLYLPPLQ